MKTYMIFSFYMKTFNNFFCATLKIDGTDLPELITPGMSIYLEEEPFVYLPKEVTEVYFQKVGSEYVRSVVLHCPFKEDYVFEASYGMKITEFIEQFKDRKDCQLSYIYDVLGLDD